MPKTLTAIPRGYTCADCKNVRRCVALFGGNPANKSCHFTPSRFALSLTKLSEFTNIKTDNENKRISY